MQEIDKMILCRRAKTCTKQKQIQHQKNWSAIKFYFQQTHLEDLAYLINIDEQTLQKLRGIMWGYNLVCTTQSLFKLGLLSSNKVERRPGQFRRFAKLSTEFLWSHTVLVHCPSLITYYNRLGKFYHRVAYSAPGPRSVNKQETFGYSFFTVRTGRQFWHHMASDNR